MHRRNTKPIGEVTRGKTARNRLRKTDVFAALYAARLLAREDGPYAGAWYVDLGYGEEPITTLESAARLRKINPQLRFLGVEIDPDRVKAAKAAESVGIEFRLGGFNLPLKPGESARFVRAFNVLRQYDESAVGEAYATLSRCILPDGILLEGTSDPFGRVWVANVLRKRAECPEFAHEALVMGCNFRDGFDPDVFQTRLPKNYIHRMRPGEWIYDVMEAWKRAARESVGMNAFGPRAWFTESARRFAAAGYAVDLRDKFLRRGLLILRLAE